MTFEFDPTDGYRNTTSFPTKPANETVFRDSMQDLLDQLRDELNSGSSSAGGIASMSRQALINGNFTFWQRGTTRTDTTDLGSTFLSDRWGINLIADSGTLPSITQSRQALTAGDIAGAFYFYRIAPNGAGTSLGTSSQAFIYQGIEYGTRFLAGASKKVTVSFWARSSIASKKIGITLIQKYGSGGSPSSDEVINGSKWTLTSTWTKYTFTFTTNTLVGKTFGTNNDDSLQLRIATVWGSSIATRYGDTVAETFVGSGNIDIAQVQVCAGESALPFQPRSASDELMLCQRYYEKSYSSGTAPGTATTTGALRFFTEDGTNGGATFNSVPFKVNKRAAPTVTIYGTGGTINTVNDQTADRALSSGSLSFDANEYDFSQNYVLTGATSRRRQFHFVADIEL